MVTRWRLFPTTRAVRSISTTRGPASSAGWPGGATGTRGTGRGARVASIRTPSRSPSLASVDGRRKLPPHGTRQRYNHRTEPCRCGACTEANTQYRRDQRAEQLAAPRDGIVPVISHKGRKVGEQHPLFDELGGDS